MTFMFADPKLRFLSAVQSVFVQKRRLEIDPVLSMTSAVAFALLKVISAKREAIEKSLENSDVAYLLQIKGDLAPKHFLEWIRSCAQKVMFNI